MQMGQLDRAAIMDTFEVMCMENDGGTYNGCLERIHLSLEQFMKQKVQDLVPNVILDHRTFLGECFSFLRGNRTRFHVRLPDGRQSHLRMIPPAGGIFTPEAEDFLSDFIIERNEHAHVTSHYPVIATFKNIKIPFGDHVLVFNPTAKEHHLVIDHLAVLRDDSCLLHFRPSTQNEQADLDLCGQHRADLILECLTKNEVMSEYPAAPEFDRQTHALVILYGTMTFFSYINRKEYEYLHKLSVGYEQGKHWKTHYFRFKANALLDRLLSKEQ